ncbi:hypothetical protein S83_039416 [Arachis hypogaea]
MAEAQKNPCIQMMEHLTFIKDLPTRKKPEVKRRAGLFLVMNAAKGWHIMA